MTKLCLLGLDPGSRITGFGVIVVENRRYRYIGSGCVRVRAEAMPERLGEIYRGLVEVIEEYRPDALVAERVFMHRNPDSALKLGQARGAALVAAVTRGLPVYEYSPNEVKQAIVGRGHADKVQIQHMVKVLLGLAESPQADAADALALALCHAHHQHAPSLTAPPSAGRARAAGSWRNFKPQ